MSTIPNTLSPTIYALPTPEVIAPVYATVVTNPQGHVISTERVYANTQPATSTHFPLYDTNLTNPLTSANTMANYICVNFDGNTHRVLWSFVPTVLPDEFCNSMFAFGNDTKITFPNLPNVLSIFVDHAKWCAILHLYTKTINTIHQKNKQRVQITAVLTIAFCVLSLFIHPLLILLVLTCAFISPCFVWSTIIRPEMNEFLKGSNEVLSSTPVIMTFCDRGNHYLDTSEYTDYSFLFIEKTPFYTF